MAIVAMLLGGTIGSFAALTGWLVFGMSLGAALGLYALFSFGLPCLVVGVTMAIPTRDASQGNVLHVR